MRLTAQQIQFFATQGYLILRQMAAMEQLTELREVAQQHIDQQLAPIEYEADVHYPGAPADRNSAGGDTIRRLLHAWQRHPVFAQWGGYPVLAGCLQQLFDSTQVLLVQNHHNCIMTKHPGFSSSTLWHQDFRYWNYDRNELITAWLALDRETARNGCMRLIPGSHAMKFSHDQYDDKQFFRHDLQRNRELMHQALRAELEPGDVLLFHSGLLHAAGRNQTEQRKLAVVYTYRSAANRPIPGSHSARLDDISV